MLCLRLPEWCTGPPIPAMPAPRGVLTCRVDDWGLVITRWRETYRVAFLRSAVFAALRWGRGGGTCAAIVARRQPRDRHPLPWSHWRNCQRVAAARWQCHRSTSTAGQTFSSRERAGCSVRTMAQRTATPQFIEMCRITCVWRNLDLVQDRRLCCCDLAPVSEECRAPIRFLRSGSVSCLRMLRRSISRFL